MITIKTFISLLIISLTLLFCVSTVSAADNDTIYVNSSHGDDSWDGLSWATAKLTIKNATETVNTNGSINIANGTYIGENNTQITINKNMTIIGQEQAGTVIDGENKNWIFSIPSGVSVSIQNLTFKNGNITPLPSYGGAIYNIGNLTVENCAFINNTAGDGGAIYNTMDGNLTLTNCTFIGNNAIMAGGGAIYNGNPHFNGDSYTATLNATRCSFLNNAGKDYGGAIMNNQYSICILNNCIFTNNNASGTGGGAIWNNHYSNCTITGCNFTNNTGIYGGAIMNYGILTIIDSNFINNTAIAAAGAIMHYVHTCTIENCTFTGNTANEGGAICNWGNSSQPEDLHLNITNSTFTDNKTIYGDGGAISNRCSIFTATTPGPGLVTCTLTNCIFNNNIATNGGAIYNYCYVHEGSGSGTITCAIISCTFNNNTARNSGGAIFNNYNVTGGLTPITSIMANCFFNNNTAINGGAIYNEHSNLTCTACTFEDNTTTGVYGNGGAIYNKCSSNPLNCTLINCKFTNNTVFVYGGAIFNNCNGTSLTNNVENCTFTGNNATHGGTICNYCENSGSLINTIINSTFTGNNADYGGTICSYCWSSSLISNIENCTFINNNATSFGGAIRNKCFADGSLANIVRNSTFIGNNADWGGVIQSECDPCIYLTITVENSTFIGNSAVGGGAISTMNNNSASWISSLTNCTFRDNNATWAGGAICNYGDLTVKNCTFTGNNASGIYGHGGAIFTDCGSGLANNVKNSTFIGNNANYGGAISNEGTCTISSCTLSYNSAINSGGAIYNGGGTNEIHFNRIVRNTAANGTALNCYNGTVNATNNWWGYNADPKSIDNLIKIGTGNVDADPWVILSVNATPNNINNTQISTITADLNHYMNGTGHIGTLTEHVPDGQITLSIPWGSFIGSSIPHFFETDTIAGVMDAIFYANEGAAPTSVRVDANADDYITNALEAAYITINQAADIAITKEFRTDYQNSTSNITTANYHTPIWVMVHLTNNGPDSASNLQVTDILPDGLTYQNLYYVSHDNGTTWTAADIFNSGIWTIGNMVNGTDYWLALLAQADGHNTTVTNIANKTQDSFDWNDTNNEGQATLNIPPAADVFVKVSPSKTKLTVGETMVVRVKVGNNGPDSAQNVTVTYKIPGGMEFESFIWESGYPTPTYDPATRTVTWNLGDLEIIDPWMDITLKGVSAGDASNDVRVSSDTYDPFPENSIDSLYITIEAVKVKAATEETVGMQQTGIPIAGLILAILAVLSGLTVSGRK